MKIIINGQKYVSASRAREAVYEQFTAAESFESAVKAGFHYTEPGNLANAEKSLIKECQDLADLTKGLSKTLSAWRAKKKSGEKGWDTLSDALLVNQVQRKLNMVSERFGALISHDQKEKR